MIITKAPFRVPLGGGGTDLPAFYEKYGGFVFTMAINKHMHVIINRPAADRLIRVKYSKSEITDAADKIQHDLVREALKLYGIHDNIEIDSLADVAEGTGLGSSGAYLVALLRALHSLVHKNVSPQELAEEACRIEIDILKRPVGKQDQYIASFGGFIVMEIDTQGKVNVSRPDISQDILEELESRLVMYFTGNSRDAMSILGEQSAKVKQENSNVVQAMLRIKEIGIEIKSVIEKGDLDMFGRLMDEHWRVKKSISTKMSDPRIDALYDLAKRNGVLGGKIMGAGGGGYFLFYCAGDKKKLRKVLQEKGLLEVPFKVEFNGTKTIIDM